MEKHINKKLREISNVNSLLTIICAVIQFSLIFIGGVIINIIINIFLDNNFEYMNPIIMGCAHASYLIAIPAILILFKFTQYGKNISPISSYFCKPQVSWKKIICWLIISIGLIYIVRYSTYYLPKLLRININSVDLRPQDNLLSKIIDFIGIVCIAPLFEEIFYRVILLGNVAKYGSWSMIVATAIIFGLMHGNYDQFCYATMLGICSGFLMLKTKSIIPSWILHISFNILGFIALLSSVGEDLERLDNENIVLRILGIIAIMMIIIGLSLLIIEFIKNKESFKLENGCSEISEGKKLAVYFSAPLTIFVVVVYMIFIIYVAILK